MFGEWMEEGKTNIWQGKKQEEAIKYLEFMNGTLDFNKLGYVYAKESIETVLNMLKKQQTDIEIYEKELDKIYKVLNIERGVAGLEVAEIIKTLKNTVSEQTNMLKEKYKEAKQYFKTTIMQAEKFDAELEKKNEIIDLMAEDIAYSDIYSFTKTEKEKRIEIVKKDYEMKIQENNSTIN